ncbi:MAG TPA: hypothetical protein PK369_09280 [Thermoclostridium sp.]|nr:hypothetical protein [Thermoclostridium sp.]
MANLRTRENDNEDKLVASRCPGKYSKEQIEAPAEFREKCFDAEIICPFLILK